MMSEEKAQIVAYLEQLVTHLKSPSIEVKEYNVEINAGTIELPSYHPEYVDGKVQHQATGEQDVVLRLSTFIKL